MLLPAPPWPQPAGQALPWLHSDSNAQVLKRPIFSPALHVDTTKQHQQKDKYSELLTWSVKVFMYVHLFQN